MVRLLLALAIACAAVPSPVQASTRWSRPDAAELLRFVETVSAEGLDPADYNVDELRRDTSQWPEGWEGRATRVFLHLAADLYQGHVRDRARLAWHIPGPSLSEDGRLRLLNDALARHSIRDTLAELAPQHSQYLYLKAALAAASSADLATRQRLRANLERWRWMPRELGDRYLLVNVPAFTVTQFEDDRIVAARRVIVGKRDTPTPQFSATVTGVILNPWWDVPDSIVRESVGKLVRTRPALARQRGYVVQGGRYRQRPGPANALGQAKLVMPNPYRVYLHDTPNRELFAQTVRSFSHGCIRTQDIVGLAEMLLADNPAWSRADMDRVLSGRETVLANLMRPLPIYVGYFTATADEGGGVATFGDLYGRDEAIVSQLVDQELN